VWSDLLSGLNLVFQQIHTEEILRLCAVAKKAHECFPPCAADVENSPVRHRKESFAAKQLQHHTLSLLKREEIAGHPTSVAILLPTSAVAGVGFLHPGRFIHHSKRSASSRVESR
jgi:hypothetical protein